MIPPTGLRITSNPTEADTCRQYVVPKLQAAGWDTEPHSIAEQRTFVMKISYESAKSILDPIIGRIDRQPDKIHWIIQGLTGIEDRTPNTPHYWRVWELFATSVKRAKWISGLSDEHPFGSEVLSTIFLSSWWKDNIRHWRSLDGHAHHVHALFEALPPTWVVLDSYLRFLYHIGEKSLPEAFGRIANSLRAGDVQTMLADANTVFLLEVLLQRHVYRGGFPGSPRSHVLPYRLLKLGLNIGQGGGLWFDCNYVFSDMFRFANELDQVAQREAIFVPVHNLLVQFAPNRGKRPVDRRYSVASSLAVLKLVVGLFHGTVSIPTKAALCADHAISLSPSRCAPSLKQRGKGDAQRSS
jgi:hypothetical protein